MISEGPCDTEDWSNDAENSAFHYRNDFVKDMKMEQMVIIMYMHIHLNAFVYIGMLWYIDMVSFEI